MTRRSSEPPGVRRWPALAVAAAAVVLLGGCASTDVRRLATDGPAAYELRGRHLQTLGERADALCPKGHEVVRQWERRHTSPAGDRWWEPAVAWAEGAEADQAQMTVQCKG